MMNFDQMSQDGSPWFKIVKKNGVDQVYLLEIEFARQGAHFTPFE